MAKFTIKERKKDDVVREGDAIVIGTRASCSYSLTDPLCAERHCSVTAVGGGFQIEDLGSSVGTFVNGKSVSLRTPLADGDEIVVGVTRFKVSIDEAAAALVLENKGAFHYDATKDALAWSKKEIRFGRMAPVRLGNWTAAAIGLLFLPLVFIGGSHEAIMEPAPTWHDRIEGYHAQLAQLGFESDDCDACHSSFGILPNISGETCMACHEMDIDRGHHPFYGSLGEWQQGCIHCHVDHRGQGEGDLITIPAEKSCAGCHDADLEPSDRDTLGDRTQVQVALRYNTFSHADHHEATFADGRPLDCASCHTLLAPGEENPVVEEGGRLREFRYVDYEACMACHGDEATPEKRVDAAAVFVTAWHGAETDENRRRCESCHEALWTADMKTAPHTPRDYVFNVFAQPHRQFLDAGTLDVGGENACIECHKNGAELAADLLRSGRLFEHATHVWNVAPDDPGESKRVSGLLEGVEGNGHCLQCHSEVARSASLGDAATVSFEDASCTECHLPEAPVAVATPSPSLERIDFPHDLPGHRQLEQGCFACHLFPSDEGAFPENPVTPPEVRDCSLCHGSSAPPEIEPLAHATPPHANVGGTGVLDSGSCHRCHLAGDPALFGPDRPLMWTRHTDPEFSHTSRGHRDMTREGRCIDCHDRPEHGETLWAARTIDGVPVPRETDRSCRACHVGEKQQFHWR